MSGAIGRANGRAFDGSAVCVFLLLLSRNLAECANKRGAELKMKGKKDNTQCHLREPGEEVLAQLGSVFEKLVPMAREIAEVGQSNGDGARVPAIRGIEAEATDSARAA